MILSSIWYRTLRVLQVTTLARHLRDAGVILCYHNVVATSGGSDLGEPSLHIPLPTFERHMRWLAVHCDAVPLSEFVRRLRAGASLRHLAAVTFDDGYAGVLDHAWPVLQAFKIPATMFVVAHAPGRRTAFWWDDPSVCRAATPRRREEWLTALRGDEDAIIRSLDGSPRPSVLPASHLAADWTALRGAVASGLSLGAHSATHRSLPTLDDSDLTAELVSSRTIIARETGVSPELFAYPYGLWDHRVQQAARAAGYHGALTLEAGLNVCRTNPWSLRRVNVPAGIPDPAFEAWASGFAPRALRS